MKLLTAWLACLMCLIGLGPLPAHAADDPLKDIGQAVEKGAKETKKVIKKVKKKVKKGGKEVEEEVEEEVDEVVSTGGTVVKDTGKAAGTGGRQLS